MTKPATGRFMSSIHWCSIVRKENQNLGLRAPLGLFVFRLLSFEVDEGSQDANLPEQGYATYKMGFASTYIAERVSGAHVLRQLISMD